MKPALLLASAILAGTMGAASAQIADTPDIAAQIKAMGTELTPDLVGGTQKLYGPLTAAQSADGVVVTANQSYGPHERNVLDVYAPEGAKGAPVLVYVHGGGFVRGDKTAVANIGTWFARHGVVGIALNYRFAPDNTWPSGAEDVAMALDWIKANVAAYGGDPAKVVLSGNSAGSMHVADYTFREEYQIESDGVIGAIIISPPTVDLNRREIDPTRDALYYGTEGDRSAQSVVNALEGRKIPVMVAYAEYEPAVIIDQTRILIEELTRRDGRLPLIVGVPGHNHISIAAHIGSGDDSLAPDMLEFVRLVALGQN